MKKEFDVNQGHGDHNDCLCEPDRGKELLANWISRSIAEGGLIGGTKQAVACDFGERMPKAMPMLYIGDMKHPQRLALLLAVNEAGKTNTLVSAYPECDGAAVAVKITAIHEWAAGVEATLEGTVLGEAERQIAFFDTRYALHKGTYRIGETYTFRLAAFAYNAEVLPKSEREFRMVGEEAAKRRAAMGQKPEFEKDGSVKPLIFRMDQMVAFFQSSAAYPDDAEFQSPLFKPVKSLTMCDTPFYRLEIAIAREDSDVIVPLLVKQSFFPVKPRKGDPIRGHLWLQGYCADDNNGQ